VAVVLEQPGLDRRQLSRRLRWHGRLCLVLEQGASGRRRRAAVRHLRRVGGHRRALRAASAAAGLPTGGPMVQHPGDVLRGEDVRPGGDGGRWGALRRAGGARRRAVGGAGRRVGLRRRLDVVERRQGLAQRAARQVDVRLQAPLPLPLGRRRRTVLPAALQLPLEVRVPVVLDVVVRPLREVRRNRRPPTRYTMDRSNGQSHHTKHEVIQSTQSKNGAPW
jgi:hypothetical protein